MLVSAAWIGPAILGAVNELAQRRLSGKPGLSIPDLLWASGDWLLYALLTPAVFSISRRWPLSRPRVVRHAILHLVMSLIFCVAWAGGGTLLKMLLTPESLWGTPRAHFLSWLFITLP